MENKTTTRLQPLSRSEAVEQGIDFWFDTDKASHVIEFFQKWLRHSKGRFAGKPFELLEWQQEMLAELFGWVRVDNNMRRYRMAYVSTAKKSGKSTILAGIGLYLLLADGEAGAEIYGAATDRESASIVFREAASMVRASPLLSSALEVIDSRRTIAYRKSSAFYRVLSADAFRAEGLNIHGLLYDELHAARDRRLFDSLRYGGAARSQPLLVSITTAGYDRSTICYEQYSYAKAVLADWKHDPTFFSCIYEVPAEDDWKSPESWPKANPSWGVTINESDFAADCHEAQNSVSKEGSFRRYRLNQWTSQDTRWIKMESWQAANTAPPHSLEGRECWCALDLASTTDTSAFVAVFPCDDGSVDVLAKFWIPSDNMTERERRDRVPFLQWVESGFVTATSGNVTDYDVIRKDIAAFASVHNVRKLAVDRWNATQLSNQLQGDGVNMVQWPQGFAGMNAPSKLLESLLAGGKLRHGGNPTLQWQAGNVAVRQNADGHIRPVKPKESSTERVDGIIALVMALGAWSSESKEPPPAEPEIILL
jgi:phage terminase large subunit-like protein